MKRAGAIRRFVAHFIDVNIVLLIVALLFLSPPQNGYWVDWLSILFGLTSISYHTSFWVRFGATPGKMALRLKVVTEDGGRITFRTAILRYFGYMVCNVTLGLGYLLILFDSRKQGLHDKIAKTLVIVGPVEGYPAGNEGRQTR